VFQCQRRYAAGAREEFGKFKIYAQNESENSSDSEKVSGGKLK
jgi:hypothetical protein